MLKALYDYGIRNGLSIPPGFLKKEIKAYISLSADGAFLGIEQYEKEFQICPDIGSLANGPSKCNPLAEKASVILGDKGKKTEFYRSVLREGAQVIPAFGICLMALEDKTVCAEISQEMQDRKVKGENRISFKVDGIPIVCQEGVQAWWSEYRKQFGKDDDKKGSEQSLCLITGKPTVPLATVPVINGLQTVGGHTKGEALFCFDKTAFQSYGLSQSANAPVSEEAFGVVKDALNDLLAGSPAMYRRDKKRNFNPNAPIFSGMKFLHWYDCQLEPEEDLIQSEFFTITNESPEETQEEMSQPSSEELQSRKQTEELQKREMADRMIREVGSGKNPPILDSQYYILLLSGNNGRAMPRRYEHGSYRTLQENQKLWREDLKLQSSWKNAEISDIPLQNRLKHLVVMKGKKSGKEFSEQMRRELAGITPSIVMSVLNGTPLPDAVAVRALSYIQSQMLNAKEDSKGDAIPDGVACQWLKVWLIRKHRLQQKEAVLKVNYDRDFPNAAYHCGALMAIYADLQRAAMGDLNATLVQRFYASASRTPTLVLGTMERMGEIYLGQLCKENKYGLAKIYENRLNDTYAFFGTDGEHRFPGVLNLEEQSYFVLGYRQMSAQMNVDKLAAKAARQEADKAKTIDQNQDESQEEERNGSN
ncbi:MAG: type I-C CRISPR-associated protein Cas8c/Csd1 [Negativibacillus sp.]|nr:type I-C CRISPR-associated protein Cas8c/Csd1 [Negativibacillus sp.]